MNQFRVGTKNPLNVYEGEKSCFQAHTPEDAERFVRLMNTGQDSRDKIGALRLIGGQMANLCFNLSQRPGEPLSARNAEVMNSLRVQWDEIRRSESK